jgi:hypothetical protein
MGLCCNTLLHYIHVQPDPRGIAAAAMIVSPLKHMHVRYCTADGLHNYSIILYSLWNGTSNHRRMARGGIA